MTSTSTPTNEDQQDDDLAQDDDLVDGARVKAVRVSADGEWRGNESPDQNLTMKDTVSKSGAYAVSDELTSESDKSKIQDRKMIYGNLPMFIGQMKGPSSRQDLEHLVKTKMEEPYELENLKKHPHLLEIYNERDKPSLPKNGRREKFKAYSYNLPLEYYFLDCEYMLKMYLPNNSPEWFNVEEGSKRIRAINSTKKNERWIFIPSFNRAEIALLDWPKDDIVTQNSTIRILVVRPSQFEKYVKRCGDNFPVICLPQDEIGAGYPRFWIQKIALRLKLDFIWMIDDSVECFYEYHPTEKPKDSSYKKHRPRPFGRVFERIENLLKEKREGEKPTAAMSPRRFRGGSRLNDPFACLCPQVAVFLNLKELKSKEVYYRPELQTFEDMMFGYECKQNGLNVFIDNRVHVQDHKWQDTGAKSPSVKKKKIH